MSSSDIAGRLARARAAFAVFLAILAATASMGFGVQSARGVGGWSVAVSPTSLTEGVPTVVTVDVSVDTATIGTVLVSMPAGFTASSSAVVSTPGPWSTLPIDPGPPAVVGFEANNNGWALVSGTTATFEITVTAGSTGLGAWDVVSFEAKNAAGAANGSVVPPIAAFTITAAPTPTPAPTASPTPAPTASPTPAPTPTPTPTASPTPAPTPTPTPTASPTPAPTATPTPAPTATPTPAPTATPTPAPTATPTPAPTATPTLTPTATPTGTAPIPPGPSSGMDVPDLSLASDVDIPDFGPISAFGLFSWLIPGFAFIGPGLLLLIIGSQVVGGGIFIPITRRVLGGFGLRRSREEREEKR